MSFGQGIQLASNFDVNTALPLDSRMVVADVTARNAIPSLMRFPGLFTFCVADGKTYQLIGGIADANWAEFSGGGGGGILSVADLTARDAIASADRAEGMMVYVESEERNYQLRGGIDNSDWVVFTGDLPSLYGNDVGAISAYPNEPTDPPYNHLYCGGDTLFDATVYPLLAAKMWNSAQSKWKFGGTGTYPSGSFYTPKMPGMFLRGADNSTGADPDAAGRVASNTNGVTGAVAGSAQPFATARPTTSFTTDSQGAHTHTMTKSNTGGGSGVAVGDGSNQGFTTTTTSSAGAHTHTITAGGDTETRPKNIAFNFFIRFAPSGQGAKGDQGSPGTGVTVVTDLTARDAITTPNRSEGMVVYVQSNQTNYQLVGGVTNTNWVQFGGGLGAPITKTATATLGASERNILIDASGGNVNLTLPAMVVGDRRRFFRTDSDETKTVTITCAGSDTINGSPNYTIPIQNARLEIEGLMTNFWGVMS